MSLFLTLQKAQSEEDVKDAYIHALGLKKYTKGLIDIQSDEIWFEAKDAATSPVVMFAQLLRYVRDARKKGDSIPQFLCVIDKEKAALMETQKALPLLEDKQIVWTKTASTVKIPAGRDLIKQVAPYIETHFVVYQIETHEKEFIKAVKEALTHGKFIRAMITPDNLRQVFDSWVEKIGRELEGIDASDYALLFFADIMHDGKKATMVNLPARLLHEGDEPVFILKGQECKLASLAGYRQFWAIYHRPPEEEHRGYLLERRDSLLPLDERAFKGAYYTPLHIVDKAYDVLGQTLGKNWQENYLVWDMCCGVGNLEVKHSNHRNIFMSTLDKADIDVMGAARTCVAATRFQYDYLNDDINEFGQIDYSISNKMPKELIAAIEASKRGDKTAKKILVLINPPYAEATNADNAGSGSLSQNKEGVARTKLAHAAMEEYGKASNELYTQFIARIHKEIPNAMLAMFSTLKYVAAPTLDKFRKEWQASYLNGFVVHSVAFDGVEGNFPIGFLIWDTSKKKKIREINTTVYNQYGQNIGLKTFSSPDDVNLLTDWVERPPANDIDAVPLKNAFIPATATKDVRGTKWADNALGWLNCAGNDPQNAGKLTMLLSSGFGSGRGFFVTKENLWQASIIFAVRRVIKPTWLNDRDQFLQPSEKLTNEFKNDCLAYLLFSGSNLSAAANGLEWNNQTWSLTNHFLPFSEAEVGANGRFQSHFMIDTLRDVTFSSEAQAVLNAGKAIFQSYHSTQFERKIRDELKLNRPDVGWYQVRKALEAQGKTHTPYDFWPFKDAFDVLSEKLRIQVYTLGFLRH